MGEGAKAVSVEVRGKSWQRHGEQAWRTMIERQRVGGMSKALADSYFDAVDLIAKDPKKRIPATKSAPSDTSDCHA